MVYFIISHPFIDSPNVAEVVMVSQDQEKVKAEYERLMQEIMDVLPTYPDDLPEYYTMSEMKLTC